MRGRNLIVLTALVSALLESVLGGTATLTLFSSSEVSQYGARCLDGSPSGYYLYKTSNSQYTNSWIIWLEGGGWCFPHSTYPNVEDCFSRLTNSLGSSNYWGTTQGVSFVLDYNYVYIQYCGGDFHSGTRTTPDSNGLYYSGHNTLVATIAKLKAEQGLNSATTVVLNGGSAGGIGTLANFDYVQNQFPNAHFYAWPASGWFPESVVPYQSGYISMVGAYQILYSQVNAYLNQACVSANPSNPWICWSGQYIYPHAQNTNLLVSQALFDNWAQGFNGVPDITSPAGIKYMTHYGQAMRNTLQGPLQGGNNVGLFFTEENVHEFGYDVVVNGFSLQTIATNWLAGTTPVKEVTPCNYLNCQAVPYQGCYNDEGTRDLPQPGPSSSTQTVETCQSYCASIQNTYAGLQNGNECWCGNSYGIYGSDPSGCTSDCTGDANEFCGAAWHNSVYTSSS